AAHPCGVTAPNCGSYRQPSRAAFQRRLWRAPVYDWFGGPSNADFQAGFGSPWLAPGTGWVCDRTVTTAPSPCHPSVKASDRPWWTTRSSQMRVPSVVSSRPRIMAVVVPVRPDRLMVTWVSPICTFVGRVDSGTADAPAEIGSCHAVALG